ncbi:hypothetical protein [Streptomyces sp. RKAG337]|uniref:hypothetical protein n=1 Tax=Streptomyces sp. RKAG337 TaxID=2893404 RepID=UPI0020335065|nr:hypothetical protein [Streptomyces sp. RKAG337]MCM2431056.1 hypothetical protein [Streptomyces sp. RKAG337]
MPHSPATDHGSLQLPGDGQLAVAVTTDAHTGLARYAVRAPHLLGVMVVAPYTVADELMPTGARLHFGDGAPPVRPYTPRPHEPVVHGVRVHGTATCADLGRLPDPDAVLFEGVVLGENYRTRRVADRARERLEAAVLAVLQHWHSLPNRHALVLVAARRSAPAAARRAQATLMTTEAALAATNRSIQEHEARRTRCAELASTPPTPTAPAAAATRLALADHHGQSAGSMVVRESAVNQPAGTVTYSVAGARLAGSVAIGPHPHSAEPVPDGISVRYGTSSPGNHHDHELVVNGVSLRGAWDHPTSQDLTPFVPRFLPAPSRADPHATAPVPDATKQWLWAVLRALATHYNHRPDISALRLAAAHARAPRRGRSEREVLGELRARQGELTKALVGLRQRLADSTALLP